MTINIAVNTAGQSLREYLVDYQDKFGNSKWGGFNSWNPFATSGTQYANGEGSIFNSGNTSKRGFVAEGDLHYTLFSNPSHTLYGQLNTLKLGTGLQGVTPRNLADEKFTITGLNLNSAKSEGHNGTVHKIIYGLMKPNKTTTTDGTQHLENHLNANDLNLTGNNLDNHLQGYNGNDTLTGGAGNDTFIFEVIRGGTSFGNDTITDYQTGESIKISSALYNGGYSTSEAQGNTVIDFGSAGTITLTGVTNFDASTAITVINDSQTV